MHKYKNFIQKKSETQLLQKNISHTQERLVTITGNMRREDHIRVMSKELKLFLFLIRISFQLFILQNVEGRPCDLARFKGIDHAFGVGYFAPAGRNKKWLLPEAIKEFFISQMLCF